jgi:hypothetical protein
MDDRTGEEVRTIATAYLADPRSDGFVRYDPATGDYRPITLEDHCRAVADLALPETVEDDVRHQFDLARNLMIYAWFVYRFHAVSQLQALRTLELALRRKVPGAARARGIKGLLVRALKTGCLEEQDFAPSVDPGSWARALRDAQQQIAGRPVLKEHEHAIEFIQSLRNDLAHGEIWLMPNTRTVLELVTTLIAGLYRPRVTQSPPG